MSYQIVKFGDVFEFVRNGLSVKQDKSGEGLPIARIETIWNSQIDTNRVGFANLKSDGYDNWLLKRKDILFSHINSIEHLGKCAIYEGTPEKLVHGMNLLCLRSNQELVDPNFILHYLRSKKFQSQTCNLYKSFCESSKCFNNQSQKH